jgi:hypothetical protein
MADTFTANYNLTKPQIGGDANTWGTLLNTNLDTIDTTVKAVSDVANAAIKGIVGMIIMWSGTAATIPAKWKLCNGANGTPNLLDRFIVGAAGSYAPGAIGGAATVALGIANLPAHNHGVSDPGHAHGVYDPGHNHYVNDPGHRHNIFGGRIFDLNNSAGPVSNSNGGFQGGQNLVGVQQVDPSGTGIWLNASATGIGIYGSGTGISTTNTGSGAAIENRPPYYALCFIMYTG